MMAVLCLFFGGCSGWLGADQESGSAGYEVTGTEVESTTVPEDEYENTAVYQGSTTVAVDSLGRTLTTADEAGALRTDRYVGIFYFLWAGEHGAAGPYDNSVIASDAKALISEAAWKLAGGGNVGDHHFWGKPLFGYYRQSDEWVMRKHVQMLTDADVDFLVFDATNAFTYTLSGLKLMAILEEYRQQGFDVPQIAFMTNAVSGDTMNRIYDEIYAAHPEYESLWFLWDGKPMIIGDASDLSLRAEVREFFRIKANQWPTEAKKADGFPWMEFGRSLTEEAVYGLDGRREVMSVSVAQHADTCMFSYTAWYGANDRTRSWHDGANDTAEDAYLYGYNFAEQFEYAISMDPEIIFITGWNEWVAQRQPVTDESKPIVFVDCADRNTSRDIEPMEGGYGDNYYLQMISYIRQYKGTNGNIPTTEKTIMIDDGFSQWNDVESYYLDYTNDTVNRSAQGFGSAYYFDASGRNDIEEMKVAEDEENLYFFVKTVDSITEPEGENWMNLWISTGNSSGWNGYDFLLNYETPRDELCYLSRLADGDEFLIREEVGTEINYRIAGNLMMVAIPKSALGITGDASIGFKWSDNCVDGDVFGFYTSGDAAPMGRAGYYYGRRDEMAFKKD